MSKIIQSKVIESLDGEAGGRQPTRRGILESTAHGPLIVVPRQIEKQDLPKIVKHIADSESDFADILFDQEALDRMNRLGRKWEWEPYQRFYFDLVMGMITNKPRQVGLSLAAAVKYFIVAMMSNTTFTAIFVSYKKEEAINKINYVRQIMDCLPPEFRKPISRDPLQMIEWINPSNGTKARIMSHAQKPIRGLTANKILFDEFAFFTLANTIYESAVPALGQTRGTMDIISTPFGKGGLYHDILSLESQYPDFHRMHLNWWNCRIYLEDPSPEGMALAAEQAEHMTTEERVEAFGSDILKKQWRAAISTDSFRQEFEGEFLDEEAAFFHKELIFDCMFDLPTDMETDYQPDDQDDWIDPKTGAAMTAEQVFDDMQEGMSGQIDLLGINRVRYTRIEDLLLGVHQGIVGRYLYAGYDVGATHHSAVLVVLEEFRMPDGATFQIERLREKFDGLLLKEQEAKLMQLMSYGIIRKLNIDATGIGMQMAQNLKKRYRSNVEEWQMGGTAKKKELLATNFKIRMEHQTIGIFFDKETVDQLYAIKRKVRANKTVVYEADEKVRHHSDIAWALMFASLAGTKASAQRLTVSRNIFRPQIEKERDTKPNIFGKPARKAGPLDAVLATPLGKSPGGLAPQIHGQGLKNPFSR
jgi:phage FluMu gp28-like protein